MAQDTERLIQPRQPRAARLDPSARQRGFRAANCNDTDELDSGKGGEEDAIVVGMRRVEPEGDGDDVIERFMYWPKQTQMMETPRHKGAVHVRGQRQRH